MTRDSRKKRPRRHSNRNLARETAVPEGHLAVGKIIGVHGLRGEVKVESYTDFPERFEQGTDLILGSGLEAIHIKSSRPHKGHVLLHIEGITSRTMAEELRNKWIYVREGDAADLEEDTYWVHDIIGLTVWTDQGTELGTVKDVLFTGANEVYVVQPQGTLNRGKDILLPAIADVVQSVDIDEGRMTVRLQPGLLDE